MDEELRVMIGIEEALYELMDVDLYSAGISFFSALGFHQRPLETAINESMCRFYIL